MMNVDELSGADLDREVARLEGTALWVQGFSDDWVMGGPIIERENISLTYHDDDGHGNPFWIGSVECQYRNYINATAYYEAYGETPLLAAMRCYVASKTDQQTDA